MKHFIVSAVPSDNAMALPVAEVEVDGTGKAEAIQKAKALFREQLVTLDGLVFHTVEVND